MPQIRHLVISLSIFALIPGVSRSLSASERGDPDLPFHVSSIASDDCAMLARYQADGSADYVPGVDAQGNAVVPADVDGGNAIPLYEHYSFNVKLAPIDDPYRDMSGRTDLDVAVVDVDPKTGSIRINGAEVNGADNALAQACASLHQVPPKAPVHNPVP
ncbi:MAG: hypothetical protein GC184_08900 [Rhizobiales bacterium]|nr:hypothetical protein [Hyphomicrobiales bacterium]